MGNIKKGFLVCSLIIGILLTGCGTEPKEKKTEPPKPTIVYVEKENTKEDNDITIENGSSESDEVVIDEEKTSLVTIEASEDFSNECAWITYSVGEKTYLGCIDKSGKLLFRFLKEEIRKYTEFQQESAYILFENKEAAIIDKSGREVYHIKENSLGNLLSYGDGYYCFMKQYADFDASGIITTIIDNMGNVLYEKDDLKPFYQYAGEGIFYGFNTMKRETYWYYNVREDIFFECNDIGPNNYNKINEFNNGMAHFILSAGGSEAVVASNGEVKILSMPEYEDIYIRQWWGGKVSEDTLVFMTSNTNANGYDSVLVMCYYDLVKEKFVFMNQYIDKMYRDFIDITELHFSNNRIVMPLFGDDFNLYVAIFDKEWKEIMKPTKYVFSPEHSLVYNCGRLIVNLGEGDVVLDENGNVIIKASELGCDIINPYANDVAKIGEGKYIDKEGKVLFESIDIRTLN